jgi:hypothetical protein
VFEGSYGKRVKWLADSIPTAHTWRRDGTGALGVRNCSCKRAGGAYILGWQGPKKKFRLMGIAAENSARSLLYGISTSTRKPVPEAMARSTY